MLQWSAEKRLLGFLPHPIPNCVSYLGRLPKLPMYSRFPFKFKQFKICPSVQSVKFFLILCGGMFGIFAFFIPLSLERELLPTCICTTCLKKHQGLSPIKCCLELFENDPSCPTWNRRDSRHNLYSNPTPDKHPKHPRQHRASSWFVWGNTTTRASYCNAN